MNTCSAGQRFDCPARHSWRRVWNNCYIILHRILPRLAGSKFFLREFRPTFGIATAVLLRSFGVLPRVILLWNNWHNGLVTVISRGLLTTVWILPNRVNLFLSILPAAYICSLSANMQEVVGHLSLKLWRPPVSLMDTAKVSAGWARPSLVISCGA